MKRALVIIVFLVAAYAGSYGWFRSTHIERWDRDGREYVIFPQSSTIYYCYRPLTYLDARITGMRFHIGRIGREIVLVECAVFAGAAGSGR